MSKAAAILQSFLCLTGGQLEQQPTTRVLEKASWDDPRIPSHYTSPPLKIALEASPEFFRQDQVIEAAREADAVGKCTVDGNRCHISFPSSVSSSKIGVVLYPGGLVDPRSYSPIAALLNQRYGFPVVIPIFAQDVAFKAGSESCETGRLALAKAEFPLVEKWILGGHSMGGIAAMADMWQRYNNNDQSAAGLVLMASYVIPDSLSPGCKGADFSDTNLPMASMIGTLDGSVNRTVFDNYQPYNSKNATFFMEVLGGNHASFGAYDTTDRLEALGQTEDAAIIPNSIVRDLVASAFAHVASRTGVPLPDVNCLPSRNDNSALEADKDRRLATATSFSWMFQWLVASPWH